MGPPKADSISENAATLKTRTPENRDRFSMKARKGFRNRSFPRGGAIRVQREFAQTVRGPFSYAEQEDLGMAAKVFFNTIFENDILIPRPEVTGAVLPASARVAQMIVDSMLRDITQRDNPKAQAEAYQWVIDHDGWSYQRRHGYTYAITFDEAIHCGYVGIDPDIIRKELVKRIQNGTLTRSQVMQYRIASGSYQGTQRMTQ